jgi:hypothetical protein
MFGNPFRLNVKTSSGARFRDTAVPNPQGRTKDAQPIRR